MYAIVRTGGKQVKVAKGDTLQIEKLEAEKGAKVTLDSVLLIAEGENITVGAPTIEGATVEATVVEQIRDKKVIVFKKKRRQNYRRKRGHRQYLTVVKVESINASGAKKTTAKKAEAKPAAEKTAAKKPAAKKSTAKKAADK